jgi:tetratricopeptide (TPR) repeat protein
LQDYTAGKNTVGDLTQIYTQDSMNVEANYNLGKKYISRWENADAYKYLNNVLLLDPEDKFGFGEESRLQIAVYKARYQDEKDVQPLIAFLEESKNEDFLDQGYYHLRIYYRNKQDTLNYYESLEKALTVFKDNTRLMNEYAWAVFKNRTENKYERGIELAEKAVDLEPEGAPIWDTLAWLYYANGETDKALSAMKKALAINSEFQERLDQLKKAINDNDVNLDDI